MNENLVASKIDIFKSVINLLYSRSNVLNSCINIRFIFSIINIINENIYIVAPSNIRMK